MTEFIFADRSSAHAAALELASQVGCVLHDEQITRLSGTYLSARAADLISIALACYTVDRLHVRGARWWRQFDVEIPVSEPAFWNARAFAIETFLGELTDDHWSLRYVPGRRPRSAEHQLSLFTDGLTPESAVALFSGGLDSLAGAVRYLASSVAPLVLLGVRSSYVIGRDQRVLVRELQRLWPGRVQYLRVPLRLHRAGDGEQTQRARVFVYLTLAAVTAASAGLQSVSIYENGIGAYNPRIAEFQWGSQANQSTHPRTLSGFSRLMDQLDLPVEISLPHRLETKAEHVARMPEAAHTLIALTASCDSYPLRRPGVTQCGTRCASCILRRQSLVAAGLESFDRSDYEAIPFQPGTKTEPYRMAAMQAWKFTELRPDDSSSIQRLWPSIVDSSKEAQDEVVAMFKRYGREWASIMNATPQLRGECGWPTSQVA